MTDGAALPTEVALERKSAYDFAGSVWAARGKEAEMVCQQHQQ